MRQCIISPYAGIVEEGLYVVMDISVNGREDGSIFIGLVVLKGFDSGISIRKDFGKG